LWEETSKDKAQTLSLIIDNKKVGGGSGSRVFPRESVR
jgi:hypothetical protein